VTGFEQANVGAGVELGDTSLQAFNHQLSALKISYIKVDNFKFTTRRGG
jgi:hypothetical protein